MLETEARYEVMCERSGKRGCCITVTIGKALGSSLLCASRRLNIRHVNPPVSELVSQICFTSLASR